MNQLTAFFGAIYSLLTIIGLILMPLLAISGLASGSILVYENLPIWISLPAIITTAISLLLGIKAYLSGGRE